MLSSPLVTPQITDRPVREPASEWASSTIDALGPIPSQDQIASNPSTPGLHIPGAFPEPYPKTVVVQDIQYVKDAALNALQTAKGYMPTSAEDVKRLMEHAGDTVGGYLPQTVTAYLPQSTPTQSQDIRSNPLSEGGTQAGPSVVAQQDIQYVPDAAVNALQTAKGYMPTSVEDVKGLMEHTGDTVGGYLPQTVTAYLPHTTPDDSLPSATQSQDIRSNPLSEGGTQAVHPSQNVHPESSGGTVGSETGIEERRQQNLPSIDVIEKSSAGGVGALPGDKEEAVPDEDTNASSTHASHPTIPNTSAKTNPLANDGFKVNGVPSSEGFQQGLDQEQLSPTEKFADEQRNLQQGQSNLATAGHEVVAEAPPAEGETVRKKPGFMDKLRGEVKVISGKLSHKESKVEEGRRMMGRD